MSRVFAILGSALVLILSAALLSGCADEGAGATVLYTPETPFATFRDVPGITEREIAAIEEMQRTGLPLSYGMTFSSEAFTNSEGVLSGYAALLCQWLTELFGIPFELSLHMQDDLINGLNSGEIDFSGHVMMTEERRNRFIMTDVIATRRFVEVRISENENDDGERVPRFAFVADTPIESSVAEVMPPGSYEIVWIGNTGEAYQALTEGLADAFITLSISEAFFIGYEDIVIRDFYPLIFNPVSIVTANETLEPIISVVTKAQRNGAMPYLNYLYNKGMLDYNRNAVASLLNDEERAYIEAASVIPVAAFNTNYPLSFWDSRYGEWRGIFFDVLSEVSALTGLVFEVAHDETANMIVITPMLDAGEAFIIPGLVRTPEREETMIWSEHILIDDDFALISKSEFPNVSINEISQARIGLARRTTHSDMFHQWFPNHMYITEYDGIDQALDALTRGEVDMVMTGENRIMNLTHFQERPDFKINRLINEPHDVRMTFINSEAVLLGIVDKALRMVDIEEIRLDWTQRTYDYRVKVAEARQPLLYGVIVLTAGLLVMAFYMFLQKYKDNIRLEEMVAERTRMMQKADAANKGKSFFLANMSHEIRTPMNSILGFSEIALDNNDPKKIKDYMRTIHESAIWLLDIINDVLDVSKIEAGKIELEYIPFSIFEVFEHCRSLTSSKAEAKGIMLYYYAEPSIEKRLLGDSVRLSQVLINLLSNAVKFTNSGTIKLIATVANLTEKNITIVFEVKDSGIGISPEQLESIFEPFTQADESIMRKFGGSGLGLTISKNLIELMGGELKVESAVGIGSKFSFELTFDLVDDREYATSQKLIIDEFKKPIFAGEVLVCDDNKHNQMLICDHLSKVGLKTVVANDGKEAVDILANRLKMGEKMFDLIFMDIHMPVMDGLEATLKIAELGIKTPIVAVTANIMLNAVELYKKAGMADYLGKPYTSHDLWKRLINFLPVVGYVDIDSSAQMEEDMVMKHRLQILFVKRNQATYHELSEALKAKDITLAHRIVHTLKSVAGQIGERQLQMISAKVEAMLSDGQDPSDSEEYMILKTELNTVLFKLEPLLFEDEMKNAQKPVDADRIREILEKLEPLLVECNGECMMMLEDIRSIPGTEELARHVEEFDFDKALAEMMDFKKGAGIS